MHHTGISSTRLHLRYVRDGYLFRVPANAVSRALLKWAIAQFAWRQ